MQNLKMTAGTRYDKQRGVVVIGMPLEVMVSEREYNAVQEITHNRFGEFYDKNNKERIRVSDNGVYYLDASSLELTALPASIGNLSALEQLDLRDNQLTALPDSMGNLSALEWLYLSGNPPKLYKQAKSVLDKLSARGVIVYK